MLESQSNVIFSHGGLAIEGKPLYFMVDTHYWQLQTSHSEITYKMQLCQLEQ